MTDDPHEHARALHEAWRARRRALRERWRDELRAERAMWQRFHRQHRGHAMHRWRHAGPWWLQAKLRLRIFVGFGIALALGAWLGMRHEAGTLTWWKLVVPLVIAWAIAGGVAWRLTRPLLVTIAAARDIGDGKLDTRVHVGPRGGEMRILATALNEMAEKIGKQLSDQRQLLAAVSHELRTPLGHMRVLIETARDAPDPAAAGVQLAELEREVLMLDDLVAKLLASSRLEFGNLDRRPVDVAALVADAAVAAGVAPEAISADGATRASIDPTLVRRAVANLLTNAALHGGGVVAVRVERRGEHVAVEVDDAGPGLAPERQADAFRAFVPSAGGGLGLGLALVSRIAVAHGGHAWTGERPGGGARVGFDLAAG